MKIIPNIKVIYDQKEAATLEQTGVLYVEPVTEKNGMDFVEYHGRITNVSDRMVWLERANPSQQRRYDWQ